MLKRNERNVIAVSVCGHNKVFLKPNGTVFTYAGYGEKDKGKGKTKNWRNIVAICAGTYHNVGLKANGTVVAVGDNDSDKGQCNTKNWRDIVAISAGEYSIAGIKKNGSVITNDNYRNQETKNWSSTVSVCTSSDITIGLDESGYFEQSWSEYCHDHSWGVYGTNQYDNGPAHENSREWIKQGLCSHCGGKMGGLFTKKCKSCGKTWNSKG